MKVILENQLLDRKEVVGIIPEMFLSPVNGEKMKCQYIGYIRIKGKEPVTILPKVFDQYIIDEYNKGSKEAHKWLQDYIITQYLSIKKYSTYTRYEGFLPENIRQSSEVTYFDVALAVINFYEKHRYLRNVEKLKNSSTNPSNAHWDQVINRKKYKIIEDELFFDEFEEKKLAITSNDFLLRLLNTEVQNICKALGLTSYDKNDEVLEQKIYRIFLKKPLKNLKMMKKKYFRDEYLKLIKVLYNFYYANEASSGRDKYDFLLTNNFELVFESMVDKLLSSSELIQAYKYNKDGKIIDHIFEYKDLISGENSIYIGDSKYYSEISNIKSTRWKQYTYVKNIQSYILTDNTTTNIKYRKNIVDTILHGYNLIPNFFISPFVNKVPYKHSDDFFYFISDEEPLESYYFSNRIFDRDTLYIYYFGIDLIFLMNGYINGFNEKSSSLAKNIIRNSIIEYLNKIYTFYKISTYNDDILNVLKKNYYIIEGKMFCISDSKTIILALKNLEEFKDENNRIIEFLNNEKINYSLYKLI